MNIPNGWEFTKIQDLFIFCKKTKNKAGIGLEDGLYPFFTSSETLSKYVNDFDFDGEHLIFGSGGKASIHYISEKFSTSTDCIVVKPIKNDLLSAKYIYFFLKGNIKILESGFKGAALKHISKDYLQNIEIPIPPIKEQKKIASILEKADNLRKKRKEANKLFDELLQSVFLDIFGDPFNNVNKFKEIKLIEVLDFLTSGSRGWAQYYSNSGEIFIRIQNVKNGILNLSEVQYINPPKNKESERTKVKENDLLISITADLGRTAVVDKKTADFGAYINQHLALVRTSTDINSVFLSFLLESNYGKNQFNSLNQEGVKAGLNFDSIRNLNILLPPIELQNQFVQIVEKIEAMKEKAKKSEQEIEDLFNSLMQNAFNGQLDLTDYEVIEKELVSV